MAVRQYKIYVKRTTPAQLELLARKMGLVCKAGSGAAAGLGAAGQLCDFIAEMVEGHGVDQVAEWFQGAADIHYTKGCGADDVAEMISKHRED